MLKLVQTILIDVIPWLMQAHTGAMNSPLTSISDSKSASKSSESNAPSRLCPSTLDPSPGVLAS